jgi:hypothetical protein
LEVEHPRKERRKKEVRCFHFAASILSLLRKPKQTKFNDANSSFDFSVIEPLFATEKIVMNKLG